MITSHRGTPWLLTLCFTLSCVGCGDAEGTKDDPAGSGGGSQGDPAPALPEGPAPDFEELSGVPEAEAGEALGALCSTFIDCDCAGADGITEAQCQAYFDAATTTAIEEQGLDVTYDGDCVARVIAAFDYLGCVTESQALADFDVLVAAGNLDGCKMYYGAGAEGDACATLAESNGDDCQPDLVCNSGVCEPRPGRRGASEACDAQADCKAGLVCLPLALDSDQQACTELPTAGEACLFGVACAPGGVCDSGTCAALPTVGEPCAEVEDLFERDCAADATCVEGECAALPLGGQGCTSSCAPGFRCQGAVCEPEAAGVCAGGPFPLFRP